MITYVLDVTHPFKISTNTILLMQVYERYVETTVLAPNGFPEQLPTSLENTDPVDKKTNSTLDSTFYNDKVLRNCIILALFEYFLSFIKC